MDDSPNPPFSEPVQGSLNPDRNLYRPTLGQKEIKG
jgi:hypothetical protein